MKCPECKSEMRKVLVKVAGASTKALSHQCPKCDHFEFEKESTDKVLFEVRNTPLKIKHKIVKLSQERLGIYFNSNIMRSLRLKKGKEVYVSIPDSKHIVLELS